MSFTEVGVILRTRIVHDVSGVYVNICRASDAKFWLPIGNRTSQSRSKHIYSFKRFVTIRAVTVVSGFQSLEIFMLQLSAHCELGFQFIRVYINSTDILNEGYTMFQRRKVKKKVLFVHETRGRNG